MNNDNKLITNMNKQNKITKEECFARLEESLRESINTAEYALSHLIRFYCEGTNTNFYNQFLEEKNRLFAINNNLLASWDIVTELLLAEKERKNEIVKIEKNAKSTKSEYIQM